MTAIQWGSLEWYDWIERQRMTPLARRYLFGKYARAEGDVALAVEIDELKERFREHFADLERRKVAESLAACCAEHASAVQPGSGP